MQALFRVMTKPVFAPSPCSQVDILEDDSYFELYLCELSLTVPQYSSADIHKILASPNLSVITQLRICAPDLVY